ncbi:glycosyltransferase family 32 protein [Lactobacillus johnsonii]|uniref:Glycosyltransferase n=1 Tax=Lactobacillus johnsonii TaxID=33959 RepID=A1YVC0_LACJH|nr:glycosyltransferase [Lactobacillus johnsonii]ABM21403.1 glycosyltransferase [Lactobacillus johnsonii]MCT3385392.1 glycosyl transferase [Lactobacillus johnsonii]
MTIPKVIHYCWFGNNPKPKVIQECINSWKKYCPDYEIKEWNESNYNINKNRYTKLAYDSKKYAFLTDYVRLDVLYNEGGVYMDTDVKLIKSLDNLVEKGNFMSFEKVGRVNTGVGFASEKGNSIIKENLDYYDTHSFLDKNNNFIPEICVKITTRILAKYGLDYTHNELQQVKNFTIYPSEYFSPKKMGTNKITITNNTYGIHLYASSWYKGNPIIKKIKYRLIPLKEFVKYKILRRKLYE